MDEYAEDLNGPQLPDVVEEYLAGERAWHRLLRGTGLVNYDPFDCFAGTHQCRLNPQHE